VTFAASAWALVKDTVTGFIDAKGLVTLLNEEREKAACRKGCVS
jgi:hypothetical protein